MGRVSKFLGLYTNIKSIQNYRYALTDFFRFIYKDSLDVKTSKHLDFDSFAEQYFSEERNVKEDIQGFLGSLNGKAPKTIRLKNILSRYKTI